MPLKTYTTELKDAFHRHRFDAPVISTVDDNEAFQKWLETHYEASFYHDKSAKDICVIPIRNVGSRTTKKYLVILDDEGDWYNRLKENIGCRHLKTLGGLTIEKFDRNEISKHGCFIAHNDETDKKCKNDVFKPPRVPASYLPGGKETVVMFVQNMIRSFTTKLADVLARIKSPKEMKEKVFDSNDLFVRIMDMALSTSSLSPNSRADESSVVTFSDVASILAELEANFYGDEKYDVSKTASAVRNSLIEAVVASLLPWKASIREKYNAFKKTLTLTDPRKVLALKESFYKKTLDEALMSITSMDPQNMIRKLIGLASEKDKDQAKTGDDSENYEDVDFLDENDDPFSIAMYSKEVVGEPSRAEEGTLITPKPNATDSVKNVLLKIKKVKPNVSDLVDLILSKDQFFDDFKQAYQSHSNKGVPLKLVVWPDNESQKYSEDLVANTLGWQITLLKNNKPFVSDDRFPKAETLISFSDKDVNGVPIEEIIEIEKETLSLLIIKKILVRKTNSASLCDFLELTKYDDSKNNISFLSEYLLEKINCVDILKDRRISIYITESEVAKKSLAKKTDFEMKKYVQKMFRKVDLETEHANITSIYTVGNNKIFILNKLLH